MADKVQLVPCFIDTPNLGLVDAFPDAEVVQPDLSGDDKQDIMSKRHVKIADWVAETLTNGDRPVSLTGDCCSILAVAAGLDRAGVKPHLIWVDAHGDFNTWETTPSGFLGGMPLAMLTGRGEQRMMEALDLQPWADARITITDGRDLDPEEAVLVEQSGVTLAEDLMALADNPPEGPLWVHFDTDIIDSNDAPAFNYPVPGGPSGTEVKEAFAKFAATGRVVMVSVSCWNSDLDEDGKTQAVCTAAIDALRGV